MARAEGIRNRLFGGINMSWLKVIIFALCAGIYTGVINQIPLFEGTSFQDIAVSYECWILFAVIIASNCHKWWEAGLKIFVFFLISQPVVFLVELPTVPFETGLMYYRPWFFITLLTFPGGALAYLLNKRNVLSAIVLSLAAAILSASFVCYVIMGHVITALICAVQIVVYIIVFTPTLKLRLIPIITVVVVAVGFSVFTVSQESVAILTLPDSGWQYELSEEDGSRVELDVVEVNGGAETTVTYYYNNFLSKDKEIILTNRNGTTKTFVYQNGILDLTAEEDK